MISEWVRRNWRFALDVVVLPALYGLGVISIAEGEVVDSKGGVIFLPGHPDRGLILLAGFVLTLLGGVAQAVRAYRNAGAVAAAHQVATQRDSARTAARELAKVELADLSSRLRFSTNERISLYMPSRTGGHLVLVARYSITQGYMSAGRPQYPTDQGCLGRAWFDQRASVTDLPDPDVDVAGWQGRLLNDWSIPIDTSSGFAMKCRTYVAFAVYPPLQPCLGVVVFESRRVPTNQVGAPILEPDELRRRLRGNETNKLIRLLEVLGDLRDG